MLRHTEAVPDLSAPAVNPEDHSVEWLGELVPATGARVRFRHVRAEDEPLIAAAINSSSRETLLHRFFSPIRKISPEQLRRMLVLDPTRETCIVGVLTTTAGNRIVCGARYVKLAKSYAAEIALTVHDEFQHCGLGTALLRILARLALAEKLEWFEAEVLSSNHKMLSLLHKLTSGQAQGHWTGEVYHVEIPVRTLAMPAP